MNSENFTSKTQDEFKEYILKEQSNMDRERFPYSLERQGLLKGDLQAWPTFINEQQLEELTEVSVGLYKIIRSIPERIFKNNLSKIYEFYDLQRYNIPKDFVEIMLDKGLKEVDQFISRGDFIISESGLKCLEYNISSNVGGWQAEVVKNFYENNDVIKNFLNDGKRTVDAIDPLYMGYMHFLKMTIGKIKECEKEINLAALAGEGMDAISLKYHQLIYQKCLNDIDVNLKGQFFNCNPEDLKIMGKKVYYNGNRVHIISDQGSFCPLPVYLSQHHNYVNLLNGPVGHLVSNKINLAVLTDEQYVDYFTEEEKALIKAHIPKTYIVSKDLKDDQYRFFEKNKDKYILKSGDGASGNEVLIGKEVTTETWRDWVNNALGKKNWIIQKFVQSVPFIYHDGNKGYSNYNVIWGLFVFGNTYAGGFLRLGEKDGKNIINTARGATESYMLQVQE